MALVTRRKFLKVSGAGTLAVKAGGMAGILAAGRAPAYAQTTTVHWLRWNDFVPACDQLLRQKLLPEAEKSLGIKVNYETVNGNDLQPRITAGIQSGAGPDILMLFNNHPHLYKASLVDLTDVAEDVSKAQGAYYKVAVGNCSSGGKYFSMPMAMIGAMNAYRKSLFAEVGFNEFPKTWDQYRDAGKKLKAKGYPIGQSLGQSFGDPPTFVYPLLWSFGGTEVDDKGKVVLNSKETVEAVKWMVAAWKDAFDEGGLAWDDASQQPRLPGRHDLLDAERRLDLHRERAEGRSVQDGRRQAAEGRHPARAAARRSEGPVRHAHLHLARDAELHEEREGGQGPAALHPCQGELRPVVQHGPGLLHAGHEQLGNPPDVEAEPGDGARSRSPASRA